MGSSPLAIETMLYVHMYTVSVQLFRINGMTSIMHAYACVAYIQRRKPMHIIMIFTFRCHSGTGLNNVVSIF